MLDNYSEYPWDIQELPLGNEGDLEHTYRISAESTLFLYVGPCSDGFQFGQNEANAKLIVQTPMRHEQIIALTLMGWSVKKFESFDNVTWAWYDDKGKHYLIGGLKGELPPWSKQLSDIVRNYVRSL